MNTAVATKERAAADAGHQMRLTVDRGDFLRALTHAAAIVERRNTIPVLAHVLLEAGDDTLRITATDLNMQIALNVAARIEGDGATTVSASLLHSIIREMPDGSPIELRLDDGRLHVIGGRSRYRLQTVPRDGFPLMTTGEAGCEFAVPARDLLLAIASIAVAQDTDNVARPYCCGLNLEAHAKELTMVAMDGKRVAWATLAVPDVELTNAILSTKLVATVTKLLDGRDSDVRLSFDERKVTITLGEVELIGKLVDGNYPPWRRVIPTGEGKRLLIGTDSFEAAVRRAALVSNERSRAVKLELSTDKLTVSCTSVEYGLATEEVPCVWEGGDLVRGFNARFLLDTLAASRADELQVDFHEDGPQLAFFANPDNASAHWLLAPMHV